MDVDGPPGKALGVGVLESGAEEEDEGAGWVEWHFVGIVCGLGSIYCVVEWESWENCIDVQIRST